MEASLVLAHIDAAANRNEFPITISYKFYEDFWPELLNGLSYGPEVNVSKLHF